MKTFGPVSEGRENHFNLLRMLAASGVLVSHAWPLTKGRGTDEPLEMLLGHSLGGICVYIFFAISGFYIIRSYDHRCNWRAFLEARLRRLFPALAVVLVLNAGLGMLLTTAAPSDYLPSALRYVLRGLSLEFLVYDLTGVFEDNSYCSAVNGSLWTLKHEFFCYMVVFFAGLAGAFRVPWRAKALVVGLIVLCTAIQSAASLDLLPEGNSGTRARLGLPFALGGALYLWRDRVPMSWLALALLVVMAFLGHGTALLQMVLSYATPLLGFATFPPLLAFWGVVALGSHIALAILGTLVCAVLSWHIVEKPAMAGRRLLRRPHRLVSKTYASRVKEPTMKALLFGADGWLGLEILRRAEDVQIEARGLDEADFTDPDVCAAWVTATDANVVINVSAYTAVDKAEEVQV